jgi:mycofactocin precursor
MTPETAVEQDATTDEDGLVEEALVEDVLVEEVSIDGMCGVY